MLFNPSQKTYEVSIRIFTDDLERALSQQNSSKRFVLKNDDQNDRFVEQYIRKTFLLSDTRKQSVSIKYIGKEQEEDVTWVYLEIPAHAGLGGCQLQNVILMEVFDDQVNMLNIKTVQEKKTLMFKKGDTKHSL